MFTDKEIRESLADATQGTNEDQPLQFILRNVPPEFQAKNQRNEVRE